MVILFIDFWYLFELGFVLIFFNYIFLNFVMLFFSIVVNYGFFLVWLVLSDSGYNGEWRSFRMMRWSVLNRFGIVCFLYLDIWFSIFFLFNNIENKYIVLVS